MIGLVPIITVAFFMTSETVTGHQDTGSGSCPQIEVLRGRDGRDGRDGVKGEKGDPGNCTTGCQAESSAIQGSQGPPGVAGPRGPEGEEGLQGSQGEKGTRGDRGLQGPQGMSGIKGMKGDLGLRGPQGEMGLTGLQGPQGGRGVKGMKGGPGLIGYPGERGPQGPGLGSSVYVRWGRKNCSDAIGTELVYSGRAGGTRYDHRGGAANHLCMPDDPGYLQYNSGVSNRNYVAPVEYWFHTMPTLRQYNYHNVPCAVCYVATRGTVLMIPAKTQCPTNWTREYYGYLMSNYYNYDSRTMYECIDKDPESVPGLNAASDPRAFFNLNEVYCGGFSCPPYSSEKELTCAVCTR